MKASLLLAPSVFLGALVACGGSTTSGNGGANGGNTVSGTVAGVTLSAASVFAALESSSSSGPCALEPDGGVDCAGGNTFSNGVVVVFTNHADATCSTIRAGLAQNQEVEFANFAYLAVGVNVANGSVTPGTYAVISNQSSVTSAQAMVSTTTATCGTGLNVAATSGAVTVTSFDGTTVAGTYDVTFGTQGSASGSFNQSICTIDAGSGTITTKPVCTP